MLGWHHLLNGRGFGWTPGVGDGQGGLVCCGSWGGKESHMTERMNQTEWFIYLFFNFQYSGGRFLEDLAVIYVKECFLYVFL